MASVASHTDDRMVLAAPSIVLLLCAIVAVVVVMGLAYAQYRRSQKLNPTGDVPASGDEPA